MKHKDPQSLLLAFLLSFLFGYATIGCLLSGYGLRADPMTLVFLCLILSAGLTVVLAVRYWAWLSVAVLSVFILIVLFSENFQQQLVSLIDIVCRVFAKAYNLSPPAFRIRSRFTPHLLPLLTFHGIISYTCTYAMLKRQSLFMPTIPAILLLAVCFLTLDTMPELGYILLFLFTLILLLMTHPVRRQNPVQANRLTKLLALPLALFLLLGTVLIPPDGSTVPDITGITIDSLGDFFTGDGDGDNGPVDSDSLNDSLSLQHLGPRKPSTKPIMEVTASYDGDIYLRAQDFDEYTGLAWKASPDRKESDYILPSRWSVINGTVQIAPAEAQDHMYIPCYPQYAFTSTGGIVRTAAGSKDYIITCTRLQDNWLTHWRNGVRIPSISVDARYLSLPEQTRSDAQAILGQIKGFYAGDLVEKANDIREFVRSSAKYDQNTKAMPVNETDFAIWFLTEASSGYCVHYATAATVLLRAAGIPARYVEGYAIDGVKNKAVTVSNVEAHAWVEYYLDGAGWIILDPTNVSGVDPTQPRPSTPTTQPTTVPSTPPTTTRPTPPTTRPPVSTPSTAPSTVPPSTDDANASDRSSMGWLIWVLVAVGSLTVLIGVLIGQYVLRRKLKKRRLHRGSPNEQASARYKEATRLAALSGLPIPKKLTFLAEKAKFSQHTLTGEELADFDTFFSSCADAIRKKKLLRRFYLRFFRAAY